MPGNWSHWIVVGFVVLVFLIFLAVAVWDTRKTRKRFRGLDQQPTREPRSMVKIVDPSTPVSRRRPRIFDDDEL